MAAQRNTGYGQGAVYGSLAYDFNNPALYPETEYSSPLEIPAKPRTGTHRIKRTGVRTASQTRTKQVIAPFAVIGILVAAMIFIVGIMAQIELVDITNSTVELNEQIAQLQQEQTKLKIAYESAFNLAEIEEYAVSELGMQKASAEQIVYIDTSAPDKAVVVYNPGSDSFVDRVSDFITGLLSYFN